MSALYASCNETCEHAQEHQDCPEPFLHGLNYSQVAGLIGGMVTVGMFIDRIGRKWGSVTTAGIMFVGASEMAIWLMTCSLA